MNRKHIVTAILIVIIALATFSLTRSQFNETAFNDTLRRAVASDQLATSIFQIPDEASDEEFAMTAQGGADLYRNNIDELNDQITNNNLPAEQQELAEDLIQYAELRIEQFELLEQSASVDANTAEGQELFAEINGLGERIENLEIYRQGSLIEALETETN